MRVRVCVCVCTFEVVKSSINKIHQSLLCYTSHPCLVANYKEQEEELVVVITSGRQWFASSARCRGSRIAGWS